MIGFSVIIMDKDSTDGFKLDPETVVEGVIRQSAVMENGMVSGKDSIAFDVELPDGKHAVVQTSVDLLNGLLSAAKGASQRWRGDGN